MARFLALTCLIRVRRALQVQKWAHWDLRQLRTAAKFVVRRVQAHALVGLVPEGLDYTDNFEGQDGATLGLDFERARPSVSCGTQRFCARHDGNSDMSLIFSTQWRLPRSAFSSS